MHLVTLHEGTGESAEKSDSRSLMVKGLKLPKEIKLPWPNTIERRRERVDMVKNKRHINKVTWYAGPIIKAASAGHRERLWK